MSIVDIVKITWFRRCLRCVFGRQRDTIAERFHFYKRDRKTGEIIHEYVAELRKMSEHCSFGENLNDY